MCGCGGVWVGVFLKKTTFVEPLPVLRPVRSVVFHWLVHAPVFLSSCPVTHWYFFSVPSKPEMTCNSYLRQEFCQQSTRLTWGLTVCLGSSSLPIIRQ